MQRYFIIGTDTDCGKTYVTCQLLKQLENAVAIKPIESGGTADSGQFSSHQPWHHAPLSRYVFEPAIAPHIAAAKANTPITFDALDNFCSALELAPYKTLLIETTGGVMCPLNATQTWLDYVKHTKTPVILVIGMRLGCLNHALLTAHALQSHHIPCAGWIANCSDPNMEALQENIQTLQEKLDYRHLATIPFNGTIRYEERILTD